MSIFSPVFFKKNFEDSQVMKGAESILKAKRGYSFRIPPKNTPVVLIVSGGMDSIMLWFYLLAIYKLHVYPIHFTGPHSVLGEQLSVNFFYSYFKKRFPDQVKPVELVPLQFNLSFSKKKNKKIMEYNPSLLINNLFVNTKTDNKRVMLVNYPIRSASYALAAYEYGLKLQTQGIITHTIFTGIVPDDGYTTRESTLTVLRALNVYFCSLLGDWKWQISAPIEKKSGFYYTKTDTLRMAAQKQIPIEKTWSCGAYYIRQCGLCSACKRRQLAFKEAGIRDNTPYIISHKNRMFLKNIYMKIQTFFNKKEILSKAPQKKQEILHERSSIILDSSVVFYKENNVGYLFNKRLGEVIRINKTGQYIITKLKNKDIKISLLISQLQRRYPEMSKIKLKKDFLSFLNMMIEKEMIVLKENYP